MSGGYEKLTGWLRNLFGVDVASDLGSVSHAKRIIFGNGFSYVFNEATEAAIVESGVRIEDGFRVQMWLNTVPSLNAVIPGLTGVTIGTLTLNLSRTGTGVYQIQNIPTVTVAGVSYVPSTPMVSVDLTPVHAAVRMSASNVLEVSTYNTSGNAATIATRVTVWVPYQRAS